MLSLEKSCVFNSRIFLGCEIIANRRERGSNGGKSDLGKRSLCISFHCVRKFVLMSKHRDIS